MEANDGFTGCLLMCLACFHSQPGVVPVESLVSVQQDVRSGCEV